MSLALSRRQRMGWQREREKGKKGRKKGGGGIEIEGRPQERRLLLVYVSESSGCLNGDTFTRAASYGGKADLSAPTIPSPLSLPSFSVLGFSTALPLGPPRAAAPLPPASLFVRPPLHLLSPSRSVAFRRPSNPFTKRIVSYTGIFHFPVFSGPEKSNESRAWLRAIREQQRVDEGEEWREWEERISTFGCGLKLDLLVAISVIIIFCSFQR